MAVLLRCCWENLSSWNFEVDHYCVFYQMLKLLLEYKNSIKHSSENSTMPYIIFENITQIVDQNWIRTRISCVGGLFLVRSFLHAIEVIHVKCLTTNKHVKLEVLRSISYR